MATTDYPMALRYPAELVAPEAGDILPLALLSPDQQQRLLEDLQALARIEHELLAAQQLISQIDLYAAAVACQTIQAAELMKALYGWPEVLEEFDQARREQYLATLHQLRETAYAKVLGRLQGG